jgi:DNA topoisomerase IB
MARLRRVRPLEDAGLRRVRRGRGFQYLDAHARPVKKKDRERIDGLVIPPAWTDVWISDHARGHIQAVGTDDAGRRQYIYHPDWVKRRDRGKYERMLALAKALPSARARVTKSLRADELDRERVLATAFRLLDEAAPRVGSERYFAENGNRGLTTLQRRDASVDGSTVTLSFPGKGGKRQDIEVEDAELATVIAELVGGPPRSPLLAYRRGRRRVALKPKDVNDYVRQLTGGAFSAKDFRTLRGTIAAAEALARNGAAETERDSRKAEQHAVKATSELLGNTPAVARNSYIDPRVWARYRDGDVLDLSGSPEAAIQRLLRPG